MSYKSWDQLGEQLRDTVDEAVNTGNFADLSRSIGDLVNDTIDSVKGSVSEATASVKNAAYEQRSWEPPYARGKDRAGNEAAKNSRDSGSNTRTGRNSRTAQEAMPYDRKAPGKAAGVLMLVLGVVLAVFFFVCLLTLLIVQAITGAAMAAGVVFAVLTAAAVLVAVCGFRKISFTGRYQKYIRKIGHRVYVSVGDLAKSVGKKPDFVMRELQKLIDQKVFYQAHLDRQDQYLILTNEAYEKYVDARLQLQTKEEAAARRRREEEQLPEEIRRLLEEGESYIDCIRKSNERIPDPVVTDKLNRMERVLTRIFAAVKQHPEVAGDLGKLMSYYLPTTRKLLDAYIELAVQPAVGENITTTKKEIEDALDTLNAAFEKLLDGLFRDKAWDISTDISALNTILAQDGLTEDGFKKN